ncbi:MAG: hypothetical protein PVG73_17670, partial [Desulfobacterales bacterium]
PSSVVKFFTLKIKIPFRILDKLECNTHYNCLQTVKLGYDKLQHSNRYEITHQIMFKIEVQLLTDTKQSALELTAQKNKIIF